MIPQGRYDRGEVLRKLKWNRRLLVFAALMEICGIVLFVFEKIDLWPLFVVPASGLVFAVNFINGRRILRGERPWGGF